MIRQDLRHARNPAEAAICLISLPQPKSKQSILADFGQLEGKTDVQNIATNSNGAIMPPSPVPGFNENTLV